MNPAINPSSKGQWLRQQRQSRGWSVPEMRRHLREAAKEVGDTLPGNECLGVMIRRWEKDDGGGVSERYRMHYCRAFKIPFEQFGSAPVIRDQPVPDANPVSPTQATGFPGTPVPSTPEPSESHDRERREATPRFSISAGQGLIGCDDNPRPASRGLTLAHHVALTAHQGSEHAQRAERRDIGEASLEHLRSEIIRLSREYMTAEPLPLFFEMRRVRDQLYLALDRKVWPRDEVALYFFLGCLSSLMADTADTIGNASAAEELARAGLAYAVAIDHQPLTAQLRLNLAATALWAGQPRRSIDLATSGLNYLTTGPTATLLHLMTARAAARLGDSDTTISKLSHAADAYDADYTDDLLAIGGQFGLSRASYHYLTGSAAADLPGAESEAIHHLDQAIQLYDTGPEPGEDHSEDCHMIARIDLATAWLNAGDLDAALTNVGPVLALPPSRRTSRLPKRLNRLRHEAATTRYGGAPEARDLDGQIEQYCRETVAGFLQTVGHP